MQKSIYHQTIETLASFGVESPRLEARLLIADVLGKDVNDISDDVTLSENLQNILKRNVQKRHDGMPIDKILGHREFYKYDFKVSEKVLSPRPDTEILVETALELIKKNDMKRILDLGVGSGCILLSILKEMPQIKGVGVEVENKALDVAKENAEALQVSDKVMWFEKNWFDADFESCFEKPFDMIVSNPPYIKTEDIESLDIGVKKYDPKCALDGGIDGLKDYRRIAEFASHLLKGEGYILLEIGFNQAKDVQKIFEIHDLKYIRTVSDLAGIERVVVFKKE